MILASYAVDVELIPRSKTNGCPKNTQYKNGLGSCSCEDHCGWDICRLVVAPRGCIEGTYSEWQWDHMKHAWVAQVTLGNFVLIETVIHDILLFNYS